MNIHRQFVRRLLSGCLAATISCGVFANALAADTQVTTKSVVVRFGDLNLSNPAGAEALYRRIRRAAKVVCGASGSPTPLAGPARASVQCRQRALDEAVRSVNNRILTAMHQQKAPRRLG
jgi:UrcA family protein